MSEMKNTIEHINNKLDQLEGRICEVKDIWSRFEIMHSEKSRGKSVNEGDKPYVNYGMPLRITICTFLESQKEKRGRKGKSLFKEIMAEKLSNLGRSLIFKFIQLANHPKFSTQKDRLQDTL